tara:strand:+ start:265 stop:1077 length:813 start_codon:yes stop_codon:yes gene_type:complete
MIDQDINQLVTIILPNFNSSRYIESTLNSVLNQTYKNLEIIVIDNGSTDDSLDIVRSKILIDDRINLIELKSNSGGPAHPRNVGINQSLGAYLAFIDSDDEWHYQKIAIQMNIVRKYNAQFVSCTKKDFFNSDENLLQEKFHEKKITLTKISFSDLLKLNTISTSGVLVEKKLLNDFRFSEYKKHVAIEDYLLWLQLHESLNFSLIINFPLLFYRKSNDSLTPAKGKIFMQKILLYSQYSFSRKKPFFFRVMVIFTYIMKSIFKIFLVRR